MPGDGGGGVGKEEGLEGSVSHFSLLGAVCCRSILTVIIVDGYSRCHSSLGDLEFCYHTPKPRTR
jgi:hypothetical protein